MVRESRSLWGSPWRLGSLRILPSLAWAARAEGAEGGLQGLFRRRLASFWKTLGRSAAIPPPLARGFLLL